MITKEAFIEKWNIGYESTEQRIEFAKEMLRDLSALSVKEENEKGGWVSVETAFDLATFVAKNYALLSTDKKGIDWFCNYSDLKHLPVAEQLSMKEIFVKFKEKIESQPIPPFT